MDFPDAQSIFGHSRQMSTHSCFLETKYHQVAFRENLYTTCIFLVSRLLRYLFLRRSMSYRVGWVPDDTHDGDWLLQSGFQFLPPYYCMLQITVNGPDASKIGKGSEIGPLSCLNFDLVATNNCYRSITTGKDLLHHLWPLLLFDRQLLLSLLVRSCF